MTRSDRALGTSFSFMNSRTLLSISWYLAVADVICWMMVVTCPNMVAYRRAVYIEEIVKKEKEKKRDDEIP